MNKLKEIHNALNLDRFTYAPQGKDYKLIGYDNNDKIMQFSDLSAASMKIFYYLVNLLIQTNTTKKNKFVKISITDVAKKTTKSTSGAAIKRTRKNLLTIVDSRLYYRAKKDGSLYIRADIFDLKMDIFNINLKTIYVKFNDVFFKDIQYFGYLKDTELFLVPLKRFEEVQIYFTILALKSKQRNNKPTKRDIIKFIKSLVGYNANKNRNKLYNYKKSFFSLAAKLEQSNNSLQLKIDDNYFYIL